MAMQTLWEVPPDPTAAVNTAGGRDLEQEFLDFHRSNPQVYEGLRRLALQLKRRGRRQYGIKSLIEALRWHQAMETTDPDYKLNNNWSSFYARLLMESEPELDGFFELRTQTWRRQ